MLKKNLFYTLILSVSQFIFPLIAFPYSSHILGPKGLGTVNFIDSFTQYFILIAALGIPIYGVREVAKRRNNPEALSRLFSEIFIIHLLATTALSLLYIVLAFLLPSVHNHLDLVFAGILFMFFSAFTVEWFYGGIEQFSYITLRTLIVRTLAVIALFVILKPGSKPVTYYLITVSAFALTGILNLYFLRKHITVTLKQLRFKQHLKPLFILLSSALAVSIYVFMDNIILGFIKGDVAVGLYSTAVKIVKLPFALLYAINAVIIPKVSLAYNERRLGDIQELINKSFAILCIIGLPITVGMFISAGFLIRTFAGPQFTAAIPVLQILCPLIMIVGLTFIFGAQLLTPTGKEKLAARAPVIGMLFSLIANLILIPFLSYSGAAITNLCTEILVCGVYYYLTKKYFAIKFDLKIFSACLIGALLFFPISFLIKSFDYKVLYLDIAVIVTCVICYIFYMWFFVKNSYLEELKRDMLKRIGIKHAHLQ